MSSEPETNGVSPDDRPLVIDQDRNELLGDIAAQLDALNTTLAVLLDDPPTATETPQDSPQSAESSDGTDAPPEQTNRLKEQMEAEGVAVDKVDFGNLPNEELVAFEEDFAAMTDDEVQTFRDFTQNNDWVDVAEWQNVGDDDDPTWVPDSFEVSYESLEAVDDG